MQKQDDHELSDEHSLEDSEDYTSSSGSDSDESSDEDEPEAEEELGFSANTVLHAFANDNHPASTSPPPIILPSSSGRTGTLPPSNLSARLANFLPSLKRANDDLQDDDSASHNLEVGADEDEPHVDMNLGLGVLEEVKDGDSEDSDLEDSEEGVEGAKSVSGASPGEKRKADVLADMMGRKKKAKPSIEVVAGREPESKSA